MNYHKTCPHCGAVTTAYTIQMNRPLAEGFVQFALARIAGGAPVKKSELRLTHSQYANFQKLRHFGLVMKHEGQTWEMTGLGWDFFRDRRPVMNPAGQFGNATLTNDHEAWLTHEGKRNTLNLSDVMPDGWRLREDYVAEKAGTA